MPTPDRAFLHRLAHQRAHAASCSGVRVDIRFAKLVLADGGGADERRHIGRNALLLEKAEIVAERGPLDRIFDVALPLERRASSSRR